MFLIKANVLFSTQPNTENMRNREMERNLWCGYFAMRNNGQMTAHFHWNHKVRLERLSVFKSYWNKEWGLSRLALQLEAWWCFNPHCSADKPASLIFYPHSLLDSKVMNKPSVVSGAFWLHDPSMVHTLHESCMVLRWTITPVSFQMKCVVQLVHLSEHSSLISIPPGWIKEHSLENAFLNESTQKLKIHRHMFQITPPTSWK